MAYFPRTCVTCRHHVRVNGHGDRDEAVRAARGEADPGHETATVLRSQAAAHRGLWHALGRRGLSVEVVVAARTPRESERARRVMRGWAKRSSPAEPDPEVFEEFGGLQAANAAPHRAREQVRRQPSRAGGTDRGGSDRIERRARGSPSRVPRAREHVEDANAAR